LGITPDKRRIPIVAAIGNHELAEGYEQEPQDAPFFYDMLAFPGERGYGVLDVGDYLSVIVLDSGHTNPIPGRQSAWLHQTLTERKDRGVTHVVCVYHVPAYPGHRSYYGYYTGQVRNAFVPVMEYGEVDLAYEHHDHTWKRTHPIRNGQVHPFGIVYLGDGAWGVKARSAAQPGRWWQGGRWYLARAGAKNHVWITTLDGRERIVEAIDVNGEVFDRLRMVDGQPMRLPTPNYAADLIEWTFLLALVTALGVVALLMAERKLKPRR